jgi:hypothetical protein
MLTIGVFVDAAPPIAAYSEPAVTESCEAVVGRARCPATRSLPEPQITTWVVVIRPHDEQWSRVSLGFHDRTAQGVLLEQRELGFSARDALEDRWVSTGAVVAAFVAARDVDAAQAAERYRPPPAPRHEAEHQPLTLDVAPLGGSDGGERLLRFGALVGASLEVPKAPSLISLVEARYVEHGGNTALRWWSVAFGIGARMQPEKLALGVDLSGQLVFEQLLISARDPDSALEDFSSVNRLGGRLGLDLFWQVWPKLGAVLGADVHLLRPQVTIYERERYVGRESWLGYTLSAGVRFWP